MVDRVLDDKLAAVAATYRKDDRVNASLTFGGYPQLPWRTIVDFVNACKRHGITRAYSSGVALADGFRPFQTTVGTNRTRRDALTEGSSVRGRR